MVKRSFFALAGSGLTLLASWSFLRFAGPPRTPLSLLGILSFSAIVSLVVFFAAASLAYRAGRTDKANDGMGALSMLVLRLGGTVIACAVGAAAFGTGVVLLSIGAAAIAALTAAAIAPLFGGR